MKTSSPASLNPDLVIGIEAAIDRMGAIASRAADSRKPNFPRQIQLVRKQAKELCPSYRNCREEDWCWHCSSGHNSKLFLGKMCLDCKLLTQDVRLNHIKPLSQMDIDDIT